MRRCGLISLFWIFFSTFETLIAAARASPDGVANKNQHHQEAEDLRATAPANSGRVSENTNKAAVCVSYLRAVHHAAAAAADPAQVAEAVRSLGQLGVLQPAHLDDRPGRRGGGAGAGARPLTHHLLLRRLVPWEARAPSGTELRACDWLMRGCRRFCGCCC